MSNIERCKTCKFYVRHYVLYRNRYSVIDGHCINDNLIRKTARKRLPLQDECSFWEKKEDDFAERRKNIKNIICNMHEQLNELLSILKNYEE